MEYALDLYYQLFFQLLDRILIRLRRERVQDIVLQYTQDPEKLMQSYLKPKKAQGQNRKPTPTNTSSGIPQKQKSRQSQKGPSLEDMGSWFSSRGVPVKIERGNK